jgi:hypothetical protein
MRTSGLEKRAFSEGGKGLNGLANFEPGQSWGFSHGRKTPFQRMEVICVLRRWLKIVSLTSLSNANDK